MDCVTWSWKEGGDKKHQTLSIHVLYIYLHLPENPPNVGKYTIHGWYGSGKKTVCFTGVYFTPLSEFEGTLPKTNLTTENGPGHMVDI